ncbi:LysR family transcriptional regulator [Devosia sp. PTR5]|uniref:LysR family transcriptional regulator n=1 Tax=Devosia oryzisoli TaxID=2774138 RepID=A0A927FW76_9HYPH|nr:LysR family transcriptional regulator [Devosia oryzisoli]MBD8066269.1 LysR family transcriptional regulator [Devosia oryzisoli]
MDPSWNDLKLFLQVARLGGLSAAATATGLSPATLGRRVAAVEQQLGQPLFLRSQKGYRLTPAGEDLLVRAEEVETAMVAVKRWAEGAAAQRVVRVSAGPWTSAFLARHIGRLWSPSDPFGIEFVTANEKVDIGRRNADIGIRNQRPSEQWLAGRSMGRVAYGLYARPELVHGVSAGYFVGTASGGYQTHSARWLQAHHADRIAIRGNDALGVLELVAAGAGISVFPCFVGDSDPRLARMAPPIPELETDHWLVCHHEERHVPAVRTVTERIATLMHEHSRLFRGEGKAR